MQKIYNSTWFRWLIFIAGFIGIMMLVGSCGNQMELRHQQSLLVVDDVMVTNTVMTGDFWGHYYKLEFEKGGLRKTYPVNSQTFYQTSIGSKVRLYMTPGGYLDRIEPMATDPFKGVPIRR